ncbi:MAG: hypothetical protein A2W91_14155 [Bacteroidetes bacterium GWF2_38_335]|nr:MAG: hypothetical protein A2W91_14155 [Bacteroidetes bacterium GWF2_38_335]OFY79394.1 MAG: hypothetical protein A2281_17000 [Bacteroidetes bacterium RIFOXYA12_FULL_38_20]HBS85658.1 hypothetical protein [Bacteroidales bacterium]
MTRFCVAFLLVVLCLQISGQKNLVPDKKQVSEIKQHLKTAYKYQNSDPAVTRDNARKAYELSKKSGYNEGLLNSMSLLGEYHLLQGNLDSAEIYVLQAFEMAKKLKDISAEASQYNSLGLIYHEKGDFSVALEYFQSALAIFKKLGLFEKQIKPLNNLGSCYKNTGEYYKAIEKYEEAIKISEDVHDELGRAINIGNLGVVYEKIGSYDKAFKYYLGALQICEERNFKTGMAPLYVNIAGVYSAQGDFDEAVKYCKKSYAVASELGEQKNIANAHINTGNVYLAKNNADSAKYYFNKAYLIAEKKGYRQEQSYILFSMAGISYMNKNYQEALNYLYQCSDLQSKMNDRSGMVESKILIGKIKLLTGQKNVGVIMLEDAIKIAGSINFNGGIKDASFELAHAYASLNLFEKAFNYMNICSQYKDTLMDREKAQVLSESEVKLQIDKLEKSNDVLKKEKLLEESEHRNEQQRSRIILYTGISGLALLFILAAWFFNRNQIKKKANRLLRLNHEEIKKQKEELAQSHKIITDSILYAKRIQESILPSEKQIKTDFPESFVFYRPKNVVSGDFYWHTHEGNYVFLAIVDCTGHGVPGAFMSMIGHTLLNQTIIEKEIFDPAEILENLNNGVNKALKQGGFEEDTQNDGMVLSLIRFEKDSNKIRAACANNAFYIVNEGVIETISGDFYNIGGIFSQKQVMGFNNYDLEITPGSMIYLCSDGFKDQFGGENNEKFMAGRFEKMLSDASFLLAEEQLRFISDTFDNWKKDQPQMDDILVFGLRM